MNDNTLAKGSLLLSTLLWISNFWECFWQKGKTVWENVAAGDKTVMAHWLLTILILSCERGKLVRAVGLTFTQQLAQPRLFPQRCAMILRHKHHLLQSCSWRSFCLLGMRQTERSDKLTQLSWNTLSPNWEGYFGYFLAVLGTGNSNDQWKILAESVLYLLLNLIIPPISFI